MEKFTKMETLKQILLEEINKTQGWTGKAMFYLLAKQHEYSPENCGRRLRELAEEGKIQADTYKGKRHQTLARYARIGTDKPIPQKPIITFKELNGERIAVMQ